MGPRHAVGTRGVEVGESASKFVRSLTPKSDNEAAVEKADSADVGAEKRVVERTAGPSKAIGAGGDADRDGRGAEGRNRRAGDGDEDTVAEGDAGEFRIARIKAVIDVGPGGRGSLRGSEGRGEEAGDEREEAERAVKAEKETCFHHG